MAGSIRVEGLRELEIRLRQLPDKVAKRTLFSALMAGAEVIRQEASRRAPVDTGKLKRNLIKRRSRRARIPTVEVTWSRKGKKGDPKNAIHGMYQELGTSRHPAQPYLRPALESKKVEAVQRIAEKLRQRIEIEASRS